MEIFLIIVFGFVILWILYIAIIDSPSEKKAKKILKESLDEEYLFDPESGLKLTLEQAESGKWQSTVDRYYPLSDSDLEKIWNEDIKQVAIALNYLKDNSEYNSIKLTNIQYEALNESITLNNYDNWAYSNPFSFKSGFLIFSIPELSGILHEDNYREAQLMYCMKIQNTEGHYFLREQSSLEKLIGRFNGNEVTLKNYTTFTIKESSYITKINEVLDKFQNEKGLNIEIKDDYLFVKTLKLVNIVDIERLEKIIKKIV